MNLDTLKKIVQDIARAGGVDPNLVLHCKAYNLVDIAVPMHTDKMPVGLDRESAFLNTEKPLSTQECIKRHAQFSRVMQKSLNLLQGTLMGVDVDFHVDRMGYSQYIFKIKP